VGIPEALVMDGDGAQNNLEVDSVVCVFIIWVHKSEPENHNKIVLIMVVASSNKAYISYILKCTLTLLTGAMQ
jgi:hypothetical protein